MDVTGNRTLPDLLIEKSTMHREKPFLLFEDTEGQLVTYTYAAFLERVMRMRSVFLDWGVQKGDKVALHMSNCPEFMIAWFSLAFMGAVMVPTNPLATEKEMEYMLGHSDSVLVLTEEVHLEKFTQIRSSLPKLRGILLAGCQKGEYVSISLGPLMERANPAFGVAKLEAEDVAAMLYTSGTTSHPKACMITHANYLYAGEVMAKSSRLSPDDRQLIALPLFHANAQYYSTMSALTVGASIALVERFSASQYFKQAKRLDATVGSLFAAPIRMILAKEYDPADRENRLRLIWFAQSVTPKQAALFEEQYNTTILQIYGMTETIGAPLINPLDGIHKNQGLGKPTLGYEVKVVDEAGKEVLTGQAGQLIVKGTPGRTLMKGYFQNEAETREAIRDGWLYTGDNVYVDPDGYFFFVDRLKDMIKRAGENIAAHEIEKVIMEHPCVFDCAVIGIPDEMRDETIKAYVILKQGQQTAKEEIMEFCKARLAKFKVPEFIEFVEGLPRTSVGKIQKHVLRRWHEAEQT